MVYNYRPYPAEEVGEFVARGSISLEDFVSVTTLLILAPFWIRRGSDTRQSYSSVREMTKVCPYRLSRTPRH